MPATTATSSCTAPVETPPITGTSLVPLMVTVTIWLAVPSEETAVKLSVMDWPGAELLDCGLAVVCGVGPVAGGIEREGAVGAAGGAGLRGEIGLALIDVGDGERAAGRQVAGDDGDVFRARRRWRRRRSPARRWCR